jgi:hypothetical protein
MNGFDYQDPYAAQIQAGIRQQLGQNAARRDPFSPEALNVGQQAPMQPQRQGLGQRMTGLLGQIGGGIRGYLSDDENRARLAMALNTMRLTPDQGLASAMQSRIETSQAMKLLDQQANRTVSMLRAEGNKVAENAASMIEQNPAMAADIVKQYLSWKAESLKPEQKFAVLSPEEAAAEGLPAGAYQRDIDSNRVYAIGGGGTTINMPAQVGSIPEGYRVAYDASGRPVSMEPIPGSKAATEAATAEERQQTRAESATIDATNVLRNVGRLRTLLENESLMLPITGVMGELAAKPGKTPAANARALARTISANMAFDQLQAMREQSPTGGALGSVTERELALLESAVASLDFMQDTPQLLQQLQDVENQYMAIMRKFAAYPNASEFGIVPQMFGDPQQQGRPSPQGAPSLDSDPLGLFR